MPNYPFFNEIKLDRHSEVALYIQLSNNLARLIKRGILKPGFKLPGTRTIASHLAVNRNTVVAALSELEAEGWIYSRNRSGWYINKDLPVVTPRSVNGDLGMACCYPETTGFALYEPALPELEYQQSPRAPLAFDDGSSDPRLAPLQEYAREYASVLQSPRLGRLLEQVSPPRRPQAAGSLYATAQSVPGAECPTQSDDPDPGRYAGHLPAVAYAP